MIASKMVREGTHVVAWRKFRREDQPEFAITNIKDANADSGVAGEHRHKRHGARSDAPF